MRNNNDLENSSVVIPAYNPDEKLINLVKDLVDLGVSSIIIVNDGSIVSASWSRILRQAEKYNEVVIIHHERNRGKGVALKTAFSHILNDKPDICNIVTADADGQHTAIDIVSVVKSAMVDPTKLILGVRAFGTDIPFRSKFGNQLTKKVFSLFTGYKVSDTQTGLRAFNRRLLPEFIATKGDRYEYEMNMLVQHVKRGAQINEVKIETIYIDDNDSSHFNPLVDSARIYSVFLRYLGVSITSFFIDILIFFLMINLGLGILSSTYFARFISAFFNFNLNRTIVFNVKNKFGLDFFTQSIKYIILAVLLATVSGLLVENILNEWNGSLVRIKIYIDILLFFVSFAAQKAIVFKNK
jgi:glycosyltransferase involved in cell wall biosynthesis